MYFIAINKVVVVIVVVVGCIMPLDSWMVQFSEGLDPQIRYQFCFCWHWRRNSIPTKCHYPDLGGASDWSGHKKNLLRPIRSTTQIWIETRQQYGISALVPHTSFGGKTSGDVTKCRLFSQARLVIIGTATATRTSKKQ